MMASGRRDRSSTRRAAPRGAAWLGVLVALAALLLRLAEPIVVDHTLCEHGEITHAPAAHTGVAPSEDCRDGDHPGKRGERHDHCHALATRCLASAAAPVVPCASLLLEFAYVDPGSGRSHPSRAPIELAPKTSPPRA